MASSSKTVTAPTKQGTFQTAVLHNEADILRFTPALDDHTNSTIKLDGFTWRVHAEVLAEESAFFIAIVDGDQRLVG